MTSHYDNKKRATLMLRQLISSKPMTVEEMHLKVLTEFGFGRKFIMEFLDVHKEAIKNVDGVFTWKA